MNGCKKTRALMDAVKKAGGGKVQTSSDTARKLATEMGGMKKGGAAKDKSGLAVMIAIGKTKPVKRKEGGTAKKKPTEGVSTRPTTASGRRISDAELRQANRDTGGMTAAQVKAAGEAIARGNRAPRERIPTDEEAARMMGRKNGGLMQRNGMMNAVRGLIERRAQQGAPMAKPIVAAMQRKMAAVAQRPQVMPTTQVPVKRAQGGAGKVRKGMMSQSGDIMQAVKPKRK